MAKRVDEEGRSSIGQAGTDIVNNMIMIRRMQAFMQISEAHININMFFVRDESNICMINMC